MDILVVLPLSLKRNLHHFYLVAQHLTFRRRMTSIPKLSMSYSLKTRSLSWSWWNYDRAPSDVPSAFPPTRLNSWRYFFLFYIKRNRKYKILLKFILNTMYFSFRVSPTNSKTFKVRIWKYPPPLGIENATSTNYNRYPAESTCEWFIERKCGNY